MRPNLSASVLALLLGQSGWGLAAEPIVNNLRISGCPASPNCVSSLAEDDAQRVKPFPVDVAPDEAWAILRRAILAEPRTRIVEERGSEWYLKAEVTSQVFRFVDDVELQMIPDQRIAHVRSASRVGYWDIGVNRRRIERLRDELGKLGLWR